MTFWIIEVTADLTR